MNKISNVFLIVVMLISINSQAYENYFYPSTDYNHQEKDLNKSARNTKLINIDTSHTGEEIDNLVDE
jgi:hypothetical protein